MKTPKSPLLTALFLVLMFLPLFLSAQNAIPVSPNASKETKALLELMYSLSGKYTLTGQHNYPNTKDRNTQFAKKYTGQTPAIWSSDMGFAEDGNSDSYLARPDIVKEAIRQHKKGSLITICWHAVPPTANEPVTFQPRGKVSPDSLASVQGQLTDQQFKDVLTPGTKLYNQWCRQTDSIAVYLKQLQAAGVPVLWRPYHEMNGDWFWWGGRVGENSTADLYRQLYDRFVNYHKLSNLVWVWNVDRPSTPIRKFSNFYPGNNYLDILSLDVYGSDFNQAYYDSLLVLSKGKPLLFGEVGNPPSPEILDKQPKWTSWVIWAGMVRNTTKSQYNILLNDPGILSKEDSAYWKITAPYRKACGLPVLPLLSKYPLDFSGEWVFNEGQSNVGNYGTGNIPDRLIIIQDEDVLSLKKVFISEWDKDRETDEVIGLDGTEMKSMVRNSPRVSKAGWLENPACLEINTSQSFTRGENTTVLKSSEKWSLGKDGNELTIYQKSADFRGGEREVTLVYTR